MEQYLLKDFRKGVVQAVLCLGVYAELSADILRHRGGRGHSMFWLLIAGIVVGLFATCIIKIARGDGYLPDVDDDGEC